MTREVRSSENHSDYRCPDHKTDEYNQNTNVAKNECDEEMIMIPKTSFESESSLLKDIKTLRIIVNEALSSTAIKSLRAESQSKSTSRLQMAPEQIDSGSRRKVDIEKSKYIKPPRSPTTTKDTYGDEFISTNRKVHKKVDIPTFERLYELGKRRLQHRGS